MAPVLIAAGLVLGVLGAVFLAVTAYRISRSRLEIEKLVLEAEKERESILRKARDEARAAGKNLQQELDGEHEVAMKALRRKESEVERRAEANERQRERLAELEKELARRVPEVEKREARCAESARGLEALLEKAKSELARLSGMGADEAKSLLLEKLQREAESEARSFVARRLVNAKEEAERETRRILLDSIQRLSHTLTTEATLAHVQLPRDDLKGKIIGRDGRNIRAFEKETGVDVIIDETPEALQLSCFDSLRREVARRSMEALVKDGRIHPQSIEETVRRVEQEIQEETRKLAEQTLLEAGFGDLPAELQLVFGRLQFRSSYGQNQLQHSLQVMELCGHIADELNLDRRLARRCGLLHDIGKAADQGVDGTHPALGYELAKKFGENPVVCNAIAAHHDGVEVTSVYTTITAIADAISAARPGARRENTEKYFERMSQLEEVAQSFAGVGKAYAMRAGRELRVAVEAGKVSDEESVVLARRIAQAVEEKVSYPGEVRVTLIRETRFVEFAR